MDIIKEIVSKYNGEFNIETNNSVFEIIIIFKGIFCWKCWVLKNKIDFYKITREIFLNYLKNVSFNYIIYKNWMRG